MFLAGAARLKLAGFVRVAYGSDRWEALSGRPMHLLIRAAIAAFAMVAAAPAAGQQAGAPVPPAPLIPEIADALRRTQAPADRTAGPPTAIAAPVARPSAATAATTAPADAAARPSRLRIALDRAPGDIRWSVLTRPDRLVIDISGARGATASQAGDALVRRVRVARRGRDGTRIVLDLAGPARLAGIEPSAALELRVAATTPADFRQLVAMGAMGAPAAGPLAAASAPATRLIMLDPGHGGQDVGAISAFEGRFEKDLTLQMARAIAAELEAGGRFRVAFTRTDDRFIALGERVAMARRAGADLFLSIHGDSAPNPLARGATVYTLSTVASDALAARVAARENKADALATVPLAGEEPQAAAILYDLALRQATNASAAFAQALAASMAVRAPVTGNTHRFAGFQVLKTADMPAALLETGYLTNEEDARRLFSSEGQRAIAQAVRAAVEAHFAPTQRLAATR